jgi:hypothetical protein
VVFKLNGIPRRLLEGGLTRDDNVSMPVIITFILLVPVAYFLFVTGQSSWAQLLPWSQNFRALVTGNLLLVNSIAGGTSLIGLITSGASVLYVRGKTLVIGGKKTLIVFTTLFLIFTVLLLLRIFHLVQPYLNAYAQKGS